VKLRIQIPLLVPVVIAMLIFSCGHQQEEKEKIESNSTTDPPPTQLQDTANKSLLVGDWTRTDAPYQIKITELLDDGKMKAGYFNPKSINIANATWSAENGDLKIYIELRDENYPGSNYKLTYIQGTGLLAGKYFQAVEGVTYDVGFVRTK